MAITLEHVNYCYGAGTVQQVQALSDICLTIEDGEFVGLIGHTGCGKSTLISQMNGLLTPDSGRILVDGQDIHSPSYSLKELHGRVGMVFQYPDYQLFETSVFADVCFGPKNLGLSDEEVKARAREALGWVHFPEELYDQPPFDLSGGQKRRAAIAGVLAMHPSVLILDEPTAGLDPCGRDEILSLVAQMHKELHLTIVLVSHSMEEVADYVDRIVVMNEGRICLNGTPREVFSHDKELLSMGLALPAVCAFVHDLADAGLGVDTSAVTVREAADTIMAALKAGGKEI